ncbi:MAG: hypothetical protein ABEI52_01405, partial [Halobacteriaceae archaeon]
MKSYDNDPAKRKSRKKLKDVIEETLLENYHLRAGDLHVLHLPGPQSMEVKQVYDELNIPRANIVGIERDPEAARQAREETPGIQVINRDLDNFLDEDDRPYDIISLDLTGNISDTTAEILAKSHERPHPERLVYHAALVGQRESKDSQINAKLDKIKTLALAENPQILGIQKYQDDNITETEKLRRYVIDCYFHDFGDGPYIPNSLDA